MIAGEQLGVVVLVTAGYSALAYLVAHRLCHNHALRAMFLRNHLCGRDLHKRNHPLMYACLSMSIVVLQLKAPPPDTSSPSHSPESYGVVCGLIYLVTMFLFMPIPFLPAFDPSSVSEPAGHGGWSNLLTLFQHKSQQFPYAEFASYLSALLSLTCMIFLGFADDVLDLRWRTKLWLPMVACIPLLMVYYVTYGHTLIVVPTPLRWWIGRMVDLGPLYYAFMAMLAVFCTNSINILAGVNGLECGQSIVIAVSVLVNDLLYVFPKELGGEWLVDRASLGPNASAAHLFSIYFLLPFLAVSLALYRVNRYPSQVFVGDTYCYFAGMTFAVVGILGHYSKTLLLFFLPQIFNFVYSCPQLFRFVPCPRHRLPRYEEVEDRLYPSMTMLYDQSKGAGQKPANLRQRIGAWMLWFLHQLYLVEMATSTGESSEDTATNHPNSFLQSVYTWNGKRWTHCSNLTLINLVLVRCGPLHEQTLNRILLVLQVLFGSVLAFVIRYGLVHLAYFQSPS